jgi:copper chaperone NosL
MSRAFLVAGLVIWLLLQSLPSLAQIQNDIKRHPACQYCGMDRKHFAHSRMVVHHKDGKSVGVCSIFCAAKDYLRSPDDAPDSISVGDYNTKKLIDAIKAYWVMGGSKSGVMTNRAKWAFENKQDALAFIKMYGGELIDFGGAMKASYEDVYEDMRALKQLKLEHSRVRHREPSGGSANIATK